MKTQGEAAGDLPPMMQVDLRQDGLLWLINAVVFHPRGFALAIDPDSDDFYIVGDGEEHWSFDQNMENPSVEDLFQAAEDCLHRARLHNAGWIGKA